MSIFIFLSFVLYCHWFYFSYVLNLLFPFLFLDLRLSGSTCFNSKTLWLSFSSFFLNFLTNIFQHFITEYCKTNVRIELITETSNIVYQKCCSNAHFSVSSATYIGVPSKSSHVWTISIVILFLILQTTFNKYFCINETYINKNLKETWSNKKVVLL